MKTLEESSSLNTSITKTEIKKTVHLYYGFVYN